MKKAFLAQQLRQRQYELAMAPREMVDNLNDSQIIETYITCSCCGIKQVNDNKTLNQIIAESNSVDEFFDACDKQAELHIKEHKLVANTKAHRNGVY
jgi:hypothetical protein